MSYSPGERRGVVAVIRRRERFLIIQRSRHVRAPLAFCFPGGWMEAGEEEPAAVRRELREELEVECQPRERIWRSVTSWGVALSWWSVDLADDASPRANPSEVEAVHWLSGEEMLALPDLLSSNRQFLAALARGDFALAGQGG